MSLPYNKELIANARSLRKNATPWERKLWYYFLKDYSVRFQRQKVIDNYIVDFYCFKAQLVVELDGGGHFYDKQKKYDENRTDELNKLGLKVLRFTNIDVDNNFYEVCSTIDDEAKSRTLQLPQSPLATAPSKRERSMYSMAPRRTLMSIEALNPQDFPKCSNIWDLKKHKAMAEKFYNELISGERITFVYIENEEYIGEVSLVFDNKDRDYTIPNQRIYLSRLIVKNEHRRQGIGSQLCEYAVQYAKENSYIEVSIGVDLGNFAALKLYQRLGFDRIIFVGEDKDGKYIKLMKIL